MNNYYVDPRQIRTNNGKIRAEVSNVVPGSVIRISGHKQSVLEAALEKLLSRKALRLIKYSTAAVCLLGFLGLVGGFEAGVLTLGGAIGLSVVLAAVEFFCLR